MRKNKLFALGLVAMMAVSITACGGKETENETTPTPTIEATVAPTEAPKSAEEATAELTDVQTAIQTLLGDNYVANMPYDAMFLNDIYGVQEGWYDAVVAAGPMMSAHVDTFIAIRPTEGNFDNVKNALENYQTILKEDTFQYPSNLPKIQASRLEVVGDYIFFFMLGFIDDTQYDSEEAMVEAYNAINEDIMAKINEVLG